MSTNPYPHSGVNNLPLPSRIAPRHLYSLDALRGAGALCVVFWHWQHFFRRGTHLMPDFAASRLPLYSVFGPLYTDGWRAVPLFFCLSGFVFYWLYSEKIVNRNISGRQFLVMRFSRLYPLHFVTLIFVAVSQQVILWRSGEYFVYVYNDLYHFILQLLLVSSWGFERDLSFNGPTWSVSVEVLLYAVFFVACLLRLLRWWYLALFVCGAYLLAKFGSSTLGNATISYFVGGLAYYFFAFILKSSRKRAILFLLGTGTVLACIAIPLNNEHHILARIYRDYIWNEHLNFRGKDIGGIVFREVESHSFDCLLCPLIIVTLAFWETTVGTQAKRLEFLGKISYSSYLLHFPLQMVFFGLAVLLGLSSDIFYSSWTLFVFFSVLIPLSLCSYSAFERPCQSKIRAYALSSA